MDKSDEREGKKYRFKAPAQGRSTAMNPATVKRNEARLEAF